jgi:transaldolase/glucose-6-phosphate isomerase
MGGSSLAAEVLSRSFGGIVEGLNLSILDSTDPRQVKDTEEKIPLDKTLFVVASKSGGTTEVQAMMKYFYHRMQDILGDLAGNNFVAITDPGTHLSNQAQEMKFRKVIYADPTVGGRFSALTSFGLLPAGLMGVELDTFIQKTIEFSSLCRPGIPTGRNPGLVLGVILAEAAKKGIDKLTIIAEEPFRSFGSWLEQLIAESSGKNGKGIIPIDIEPFVDSKYYSRDRLFIYIKNDGIFEDRIKELIARKLPVITYELNDPHDLGSEFFRWEMAIAIACSIMEINVFNQPDVQDNKNRTKQRIDEFLASGEFKFEEPLVKNDAFALYSPNLNPNYSGKTLKDIIDLFLDSKEAGDYVAINAYLPRNKRIKSQLQDFRKYVLTKTNLATTLGFGPRFLHSTGQLHKGGPNSGLIIQIVDKVKE